ncbi:MAG: hypothetical protein CMB31_00395 [Euryarchaeota archaeon]|nr:hypothetical protein [Euryarchaeota archaeon]
MEIVRMPWLGRNLKVVESSDSSLLDVLGTVVNESRNMLVVRSRTGDRKISKSVIKFTIDDSEVIDGEVVRQRPENRIHMKWRMN